MVIHKLTGSVETRQGLPNENFGEYENVFVVDDESELGKKILLAQPFFDFILDEEGNLINITPTERPPDSTPEPTAEDRIQAIEGTLLSPPAMEDRISSMEDVTMAILDMMALLQ
jgi:hypothetical protein